MAYANFCRLVQKGAVVALLISGVTRPILIKFAHDVATILALNTSESKLPYSYPFCNARMTVILPILPKIGCYGNVP